MENNFGKVNKENPKELPRREFMKLMGLAGAGLISSEVEPIFAQRPDQLSKGTEIRERKVFKLVNLEQILETIRKTQTEHGYFRTNKNKKGEYFQYPDVGRASTILIKSENFPIEDGVKEAVIAHTHRDGGSIRAHFRTMPPYPPSLMDWRHTQNETERFAKKNIKLSTEVIELSGIWSINFKRNENTDTLLQFLKEEATLRKDNLPPDEPDSVHTFMDYIYLFRAMDPGGEVFRELYKDPVLREFILKCQKINSVLNTKYPEIFSDTKRILETQKDIMQTANTNDLVKRMALATEYSEIAQKYGFKVEYKPFKN